MSKLLEEFYDNWSRKSDLRMSHEIMTALEKSKVVINGLRKIKSDVKIETIIDFGCGYGVVLDSLANYLNVKKGYGFDFSQSAIDYATKKYNRKKIHFYKLVTLDNVESVKYIKSKLENIDKVDCILLIDILEHVQNCKKLIMELSRITKYFIIKLPLESSILDNYILHKQDPGPNHYNGHLWEFDVNDVYYFIRRLGLIPIFETTYVYNMYGMVPPQETLSVIVQIKYGMLRFFKLFMSYILPKKIFLSLIGGGGYWCIATYNQDYVLTP